MGHALQYDTVHYATMVDTHCNMIEYTVLQHGAHIAILYSSLCYNVGHIQKVIAIYMIQYTMLQCETRWCKTQFTMLLRHTLLYDTVTLCCNVGHTLQCGGGREVGEDARLSSYFQFVVFLLAAPCGTVHQYNQW